MEKGLVFDINEFAVYDGPGIRTTVFLKGCPLKCLWCHNPEGISFKQEVLKGSNGCDYCGKCDSVCDNKALCVSCGKCIIVCHKNLRRFAGSELTSEALAKKLLKNKDVLLKRGGITFTGGEPLGQHRFLFEVMERLYPLHIAVETCGCVTSDVYREMLLHTDLVITDIKHADSATHKEYTGVGNKQILENLEILKESGNQFIIRIPVIPQVNDTAENMRQTAKLLVGSKGLVRVELLKYHETAGAKYELLGQNFVFRYSQPTESFEPLIAEFEKLSLLVFVP